MNTLQKIHARKCIETARMVRRDIGRPTFRCIITGTAVTDADRAASFWQAMNRVQAIRAGR